MSWSFDLQGEGSWGPPAPWQCHFSWADPSPVTVFALSAPPTAGPTSQIRRQANTWFSLIFILSPEALFLESLFFHSFSILTYQFPLCSAAPSSSRLQTMIQEAEWTHALDFGLRKQCSPYGLTCTFVCDLYS